MAAEPIDDRDPGQFGRDSGGAAYVPGDEQFTDDFDPRTSPFDGPDDFLNDLPAELREPYMRELWDGEYDPVAAGFLHRTGGQRGAGFAAGGVLDTLEPGPVLAEFTAEAWAGGLDKRGESELIGVLCAWRRLASWAAAGEAATVIALARRRAAQARQRQKPDLIDHVDAELAAALTLTGRGAGRLLELAHALSRLPMTMAALETGQIDWARAVVMADELVALTDTDARKAEAIALPRAGELTTGQLRAALRRIVLLIDPEAVIRRRQAARKDAAVQVWDEASGNSALAGRELPPAEAIAADKRITALADWLKGQGATGTLNQLRAAVFTALLAGRPVSDLLPGKGAAADTSMPGVPRPAGSTPRNSAPGRDGPDGRAPGDSGPGRHGRGAAGLGPAGFGPVGFGPVGFGPVGTPDARTGGEPGWQPPVAGTVNLTMPLSSWLGLSNRPGEVAGFGPADADTCRDLAGWLAAHPATRWCVTLTDPGGYAMAHACARRGPGPPGPGLPRPGPPEPGPPRPGPPEPGPPSPGPPSPDPPGSQGPGPPGADLVASWLARLRMVRLECGDCSHQRESPRYRPPPALRHLIKTRQRTCGFPGCRRPAVRCDLDHTIPFHLGGKTCECNMAALCRHHHQVKQADGWSLAQPEPGVLVWSAPHGRAYQTRPDPYPV